MYTLKKSYIKKDFGWSEKDISSETLATVLKYQNARITIQWDTEPAKDFFTNVNTELLYGHEMTKLFSVWLGEQTKGSLKTTKKARGLVEANVVKFINLDQYEVTAEVGNIRYGDGVAIPVGLDTDIKFTNQLPDYDERSIANITKNCLAVVNGSIYTMAKNGKWGYIMGGNEALRLEKENIISLIDFTSVGGIDTIPIDKTTTKVLDRTKDDIARNITRVRITSSKPITDCTPLLVLDGYLHVLDGSYKEVSATEMVVEVNHIRSLFRAAQKPRFSRNWVSPANLRQFGMNLKTFDIVGYLAATESFMVLVCSADLCMHREPVTPTDINGIYSHYRAPMGIMYFDDMTLAPYYISDYNEHSVALNTIENHRPTYTFATVDLATTTGIAEYGYTAPDNYFKDAWILDLYTFA